MVDCDPGCTAAAGWAMGRFTILAPTDEMGVRRAGLVGWDDQLH